VWKPNGNHMSIVFWSRCFWSWVGIFLKNMYLGEWLLLSG